jgi:AcrR family transcriptional regulator
MSGKRQDLVDTAIELFSAHGFHATGIDRIAEEANVSKKTMYHHFRSKEELIIAALKQHDGMFRNGFMNAVDKQADSAYERLLAVFDVAQAWFSDNKFFGCMFINAIGEYSERNTAIKQVCKEFKRLMRAYIEELAIEAEIPHAQHVAASLAILLEGSIVTAQVSDTPDSAATARDAAKVLIDNALKQR